MKKIYNADMVSQNMGTTIRNLATENLSCPTIMREIHAEALQTIARELVFCWDELTKLRAEKRRS